jgi:phospholipase D1/2
VPPGLLPPIPCPDTGTVRNAGMPPSAWGDIFTAIRDAKLLIYIATWHFSHSARAQPPPGDGAENPPEGPTIGELLKRKAEEGVRMNIILWDVVSSKLKRNSLAATKAVDLTHNGAAVDYFRGEWVRNASAFRPTQGGVSVRTGTTLYIER